MKYALQHLEKQHIAFGMITSRYPLFIAVGRALMSSYEIQAWKNGSAVAMRHVESL